MADRPTITTGRFSDRAIDNSDGARERIRAMMPTMIRSIMLLKFTPEATEAQIDAFAAALAAVPFERRRHFEFHRDARLTDDAMDAAIIAEFDDDEAYRAWLDDPDHDKVRSEYLAPIRAQRERILIRF
ncbi:MAG: Dabb family protein [Catenulispora sp.]